MVKETVFAIYEEITTVPEISTGWIIGTAVLFVISYLIFCWAIDSGFISECGVIVCICMFGVSLINWRGRYLYGFVYIASYVFLAWITVIITDRIEEKKSKDR